ncbi:hypothetical protein F4560_005878 [Saccharothrix ecbatanensis]|uniref:Uncharacterized protein n=1 Tax=Saccharothrix ecbatanensis TaxID=1105145 RepID=A0A7W9M3J3_9PSEU|nr:hypothetical protein [Saccharothrix ecbatanensis]
MIRKQPVPVRMPHHGHAAGRSLEAELLGDEERPVVRRPPTRAVKLAGVATGAIVLFAAVSAASFLAGNRPTGPEQSPAAAPAAINGASALRPDVLSAELGGARPQPATAPARHGAPPAADPPAESAVVVPPSNLVVGPNPQVDVVRRFFELLPANPADASRLLSRDLLGGDAGDFVASWDDVQAITIESTTLRPDGTVLAVVSMQERTGRWMRVEQVFRLTDTTVPRIVAAEVLSAQRS